MASVLKWPCILTLLTWQIFHASPIPLNATEKAANSNTAKFSSDLESKNNRTISIRGKVTNTTNSIDNDVRDKKKVTDNAYVVHYLQQFHYIPPGAMTSEEGAVQKLKKFQEMANIDQTGLVDEDTLRMMQRPRCGMPDIDDPIQINDMMGAHEEPECKDHTNGDCNGYRGKRYTLYGTKWTQKEIYYCIINYPENCSEKNKKIYDHEIADAIRKWTVFIPLKIKKRECDEDPEIMIKFVRGMHGDRFVFDGAGGVLAHAFFPSRRPNRPHPLTGDVHMDIEEKWVNKGRGKGTCFPYVFTHELGHSLGLTHSKDKNSLMWPFYIPCNEAIELQLDDIKGIQAIYGEPEIQTVEEVSMLHESPELFKSTREAQKYCREAGQQLCSRKDVQRLAASDPDLHHTEWFWIRDGAPTMAKVDEAQCQLLKDDHASMGCYYDKLLVTTNVNPEVKALCCPLRAIVTENKGPETVVCDGVFDAMIRIRAEGMFDSGEEGISSTRLHSFVFKDDMVYAFDIFGAKKGFPKEIKTAFPGFEEDYVCSVVNLPFSGGSVRFILFGQDKYYVFEVKDKFVLLPGYPLPISMWKLQGLKNCPRVVFILDDTIHFVQDTKHLARLLSPILPIQYPTPHCHLRFRFDSEGRKI